tara:strand:+ start:542 stop:649 length:108 start_codon:yes stop_codon:yes gene_type:complete
MDEVGPGLVECDDRSLLLFNLAALAIAGLTWVLLV